MQAFSDYDLHDGIGMAELVAKGEVHPRELLAAARERLELWNPHINAVVHRMDRAADEAVDGLEAVGPGPLKGVPMVLKDLHAAYPGEPMTSACRFLRGYVPTWTSTVVERLRGGGLVVLGKTNAPELGILGVTEPELFGPTRNPWSLEHTPGGSSGGSGAAVAAGIAPIGHGGDGGGSIRIPASCCGLFGLKPTRGRVPTGPEVGESWAGLDSDGFITRSVRDSAALLDLVAGPDLGAPYLGPPIEGSFLEAAAREPGALRIAVTTDSLLGTTTHPDCRDAVEKAVRVLEGLGHTVVDARPPFDRQAMARAYLTIVASSVALDLERAEALVGRPVDPREIEPATWFLGQVGRAASGLDLHRALEARHLAWRRMAAFFEEHDLLLTPTLAYPPQLIGEGALKPAEAAALRVLRAAPARRLLELALDKLAGAALEKTGNTMLFNLTGQPAMSLPLHWNDEGLPIGVQLAARQGGEATLLSLAAQVEAAHPWKDRRPPAAPPR